MKCSPNWRTEELIMAFGFFQQVLDGVRVSRADTTHAKFIFTGKARSFLRGFRPQRLITNENQAAL